MKRAERAIAAAARTTSRLGPIPQAVAAHAIDRLPSSLAPRSGSRLLMAHGIEWQLDLADNLQRTLYFTGRYEPRCVDHIVRSLREGDLVLDVGANIGTFTVPVAQRLRELGGGRVIAVEPQTRVRRALQRNVSNAGVSTLVTIVPFAFSDRDGPGELRASQQFGSDDHGTVALGADGETIEAVGLVHGSRWLADHEISRVDVIKIDVEGHEAAVLRGLEPLLTANPPRLVQVEVVPRAWDQLMTDRAYVFSVLQQAGMRLRWVRPRGITRARAGDGNAGNLLGMRPGR